MNSDHLANERTFLAYLRTALAFVGFGFVIARFSLFAREFSLIAHVRAPDTHISTELGVGMAIVGMLTALYGSFRYTATKRAITTSQSAPLSSSSAIVAGVVVAGVAISVAVALFAYR